MNEKELISIAMNDYRNYKYSIYLFLFIILLNVEGRPQGPSHLSFGSKCFINGKSGRVVSKSECWRCMVVTDEETFDIPKDSENSAKDVSLPDIDYGGGDIINLRETNPSHLTCLEVDALDIRKDVFVTRSSEDAEEEICCEDEFIKIQCSGVGSRCVQESFCKAENINTCSSEEYNYDQDQEVAERSGYDEYGSSDMGCRCEPPRNILALLETQGLEENIVCCNNVVSSGPLECEEGFKAVPESQCDNFDARLDVASEDDATLIILRETDQTICCPERDVKTCDLDKGFRMVPESLCSVQIRKDASEINGEEASDNIPNETFDSKDALLINLRQSGAKEICCAEEDIIKVEVTCDEQAGARCVPKSKCSNGGRKGNTCAVDLRSVDLRQDYDSEEEVVCCSEELIKSNNSCENGYTCVPSKRCNANSNSVDLRDDETEVGPRQDNEEPQACRIDVSDDNVFVDITQRQATQNESEDDLVCCRNEEVLVFTECPISTDICVPSQQCLGGGENVDLREQPDDPSIRQQSVTSCGLFIRQDKGKEEVDLRKFRVDLRQSSESSDYYDDYYEYEDDNMVCCSAENYIKSVDDCSDQEDHVCILASDCKRETVTPCKGPATDKKGNGGSVDLRFNEDYVCCSSKDVIPTDPIECFDIPNHDCVAPSLCLTGQVDLREGVDLRSASDTDKTEGYCEKVEILELSSLSFDTRNGGDKELICCDEKDISYPSKTPPPPKCRDFEGHRCIEGDTCKVPKILGENLDPHDAIDIRAFEHSEEDSEFDGLCPKNKVCCEEKDIEIPPPPVPSEPIKPSETSEETSTLTPEVPEESYEIPPIAPEGKWPGMCGIYYKHEKTYAYLAGASLVTPGVVMTAAHWVVAYTYYPQLLRVRCGHTNIKFTEDDNKKAPFVASITIHPSFNRVNLYNDVALLHLITEFDKTQNDFGVVRLPSKSKQSHKKYNCIATGWGRRGFDHPFSNVLKQIKLPLMDNDKCEGTFINRTRLGDPDQPKFKLHKSFICAGGKHGEDTCRGDGGGPLMCPTTRTPKTNDDYVQVGITSWGIGCGQSGVPGAYASISSNLCFIDWAIKCKEQSGYQDYINIKECETGGKPWIDKHIKKLESHLKYIQENNKLQEKYSTIKLQNVEENLNLQLDESLRLKQACANHLKRDQNGLVQNVKAPDRAFVRNAQVEVITNSENLQFAIR